MANRYYIEYPNDFANEYSVYVVPDKDSAKKFETICGEAKRITRIEAIERGWSRPKLANECGEQWYGGFVNGNESSLYETIESAIRGTLEYISDKNKY